MIYNVGDIVRILPIEEIEERGIREYGNGIRLPSGVRFPPEMNQYCGREMEICGILKEYLGREDHEIKYKLKDGSWFVFTSEMFELAYPPEESEKALEIDFDEVMNGV